MKKKYKNYAFVLGGSVNSLGVVKALGWMGIPTFVIHENQKTISKFSRYAHFLKSPNPINDVDLYVNFLLDLQKKFDKPSVLLPTSDVTVLAISKYRNVLAHCFKFNLPSSDIVEKITSKEGFYNLANKYQLTVPKTFSINGINTIETVLHNLDFPCALKPIYSHSWRTTAFRQKFGRMQIYKVDTIDQLISNYKIFSEIDSRMVVQEFIHGNDDCEYSLHTYTSTNGLQMINFLAHKLRLDPIHSGSGAFIQSAHQTEITQMGNDFLKALNYRGMSSFQFKWDPIRRNYYAIELNPRYSLWNFLEPSCGVNYPFMNYSDCLGYQYEIPQYYEDGVKWFSIERDINAFRSYRNESSLTLKDWIRSYRGKKVCAEFSWDDLQPFFYWLWTFFKNSILGLMKKF